MNILKPQNLHIQNLENRDLSSISEDEKLNYYKFENEECNNIKLYEIEFKHYGKIEKLSFVDVAFEQCDFSNTNFVETSFIRCEFNNCKISGCNFVESRLYNVAFIETNASYMNISMNNIENILFKNTDLKNSYFQETKTKNIYFDNADLTQSEFFKTSLKDTDLSNSKIEGIAIPIEDIKGAIIDQFQAIDLLYLIGVKLK